MRSKLTEITNLEEFIRDEHEYFAPMLERQSAASEEQKKAWRKETIRERQARISMEVFDKCNGTVQRGLFKGLKLAPNPWWGGLDLGSQCLGYYEQEIMELISSLPDQATKTFIDIGAADGYYAVGMLLSKKSEKCICFEASSVGRAAIRDTWTLNGAPGELEIYGLANQTAIVSLSELEHGKTLALVDIEGGEFDLLTEAVINKLAGCSIIIEVHEWKPDFLPNYCHLIRRLHREFDVSIIPRVQRNVFKDPSLRDLTDDNRLLLISERRPSNMRFLYLNPKQCKD